MPAREPTASQAASNSGTRGARRDPASQRWVARPVLAGGLQVLLVLAPVCVAALVVRVLAGPLAGEPWWVRFAVAAAVAICAALIADRLLRRFLPVAALLRMTMLFPDRAPSRLAVARRVGHPSALARAAASPDETLGQAAERILVLITALGVHDRRTRGRSERVRVFTDLGGEQLGLHQSARDRLRWAALLHDLGKVEVPARVLNKPEKLDAAEWELIRRHPERGTELAGSLGAWLGPWGSAIGEHHERFDGTGYPLGLRGPDISLAGRIVAVADAFEVMTAARSYKRPMSVRAARAELVRAAGTQFDPRCVRALLSASLPRLLWSVGPLSFLANLPIMRSVATVGRALDGTATVTGAQAAGAAVAAMTGVAMLTGASPSAQVSPESTPAATVIRPATPTPAPTAARSPSVGPPTATPSTSAPASPTLRPDRQRATGSGTPSAQRTVDRPLPSLTTPVRPPRTRPAPSATRRAPSPTPVADRPAPAPAPVQEPTPDRTPPSLRITAAPVLRLLTSTATIAFESDDPHAQFRCRLDRGTWDTCTSPTNFTHLKLGAHRIEVYAVDAAGNESERQRVDFFVVSLSL